MDPVLIVKIVSALGYSALEYWLGKTTRVKAGSVIELAINATKKITGAKPHA